MNYEDQKKFDELNQKWLEAIKDWKKIIAEKDKRIKELEYTNAILKTYIAKYTDVRKIDTGSEQILIDTIVEFENNEKDQELTLYKKALELACLKIYSGNISDFDYVLTPQNIEAHFLQTAKEKINEQEK